MLKLNMFKVELNQLIFNYQTALLSVVILDLNFKIWFGWLEIEYLGWANGKWAMGTGLVVWERYPV